MYDYIITGGGAAGLSLIMRMIRSGKFAGKKILLLEASPKISNDRTWCFWETGEGFFEDIVYRKWDKLWFHSNRSSSLKDTAPYQYKLIRGIDFYDYCNKTISATTFVDVQYGKVHSCNSDATGTYVVFNDQRIDAKYIFNSIIFSPPVLSEKQFYLLQHFKGWIVKTNKPSFNPQEATLMDFRVTQEQGTTFVYVMPFSATEALIEYTLFSAALLEDRTYDNALKLYCDEVLKLSGYEVLAEERGQIPMTNFRFGQASPGIVNIGTAGGWTKASSGYTFQFIQERSASIVASLIKTGKPQVKSDARRFNWYDSTLLHILSHNKMEGAEIFTRLFESNDAAKVFKFLDNKTSLAEELRIISCLPTRLFAAAGIREFSTLFS